MLYELFCDLPFLREKYHKASEPFDPFQRMAYHGWPADPATGYDDAEMNAGLNELKKQMPQDAPHAVLKARSFAYVLDHMRIGFSEHDYFPLLYNWNRPLRSVLTDPWKAAQPKSKESAHYLWEHTGIGDVAIWLDYDHSVPDWHALYELGFPGILQRTREEHAKRDCSPDEEAFFAGIEITYEAILRLITRLRRYVQDCRFSKAPAIAACLAELEEGAPKTMYGQLMLIFLYWFLSESIDMFQVRSLGSGLDADLCPRYRADLDSGRYSAEELDTFIGYFLMQYSAIGNYWGQPLYLGGTNADGSSRVNCVSERILRVYDALGIYNPKIHIRYGANTPDSFLLTILDMIRHGHSSFVFLCDDTVRRSLIARGVPPERAWDSDTKGCYEYALRAGEFSAAPFYLNIPSSFLRALMTCDNDTSYDAFEERGYALLGEVIDGGISVCNELEAHIKEINPSNMLSGTILHSLRCARDAYHDGAELNTTVLLTNGFGTAVDMLMAVRVLVYEQKVCTLAELKQALRENWPDPKLRARALHLEEKFGRGESRADACAKKLADFLLQWQGRPNSRGGYYKIEMHSALQYVRMGKKLPATPDGRRDGEETSKNASPTPGMDAAGVTGVIRSALALEPGRFWEGFGLDLMLHESAVKGEDGLAALLTLLRTYDAEGGASVQFNIVNAETLRDAQAHPEKYENLQIRVCGWNALFRDLPKAEQDAFILRAEALS